MTTTQRAGVADHDASEQLPSRYLDVDGRTLEFVVAPDLAEVAVARRFVADELRDHVEADLIADVELITSELVTNAVEHGASHDVTIILRHDDKAVSVTVASVGASPGVGQARTWDLASADEITGRGLAIVRLVGDRVEVQQSADRLLLTVRCLVRHRRWCFESMFEPAETGYASAMTMMTNTPTPHTTVPGLGDDQSVRIISILQERLSALLDLQLTLKHIHWNVVGVNFISIHEFLDPQVDAVRAMTDAVAERIATLGGEPMGTPGAIIKFRSWDDYALNRQPTVRHLSALDDVYTGVITDHRAARKELADLDPVTEDLFVGHLADLEQYQWLVRAHLQDSNGDVVFRDSER